MVARLASKQAKKRRRTGGRAEGAKHTPGLHLAGLTGPPQEVRDVFGKGRGSNGDDIEGLEVPGGSRTAMANDDSCTDTGE
jgi:hypothetical protein